MLPRVLAFILLAAACRSAPPRAAHEVAGDSGVIQGATVVAFTLKAADTLTEDAAEKLREFQAYTELVFPILEEQGIAVRSTHSDTLVVVMENGPARTIMLRGLDFPYGYVLVEPGFAETILTGVVTDDELLEEASYYFGLDRDAEGEEAKRQVVMSGKVQGVRSKV